MGGNLRSIRQMEGFRQVMRECGFMDITYRGPKFTWSRRYGSKIIAERLDRGVANKEWMDRFAFSIEHHLPTVTSDHSLLLFNISTQEVTHAQVKKSFRFENMWVRNNQCEKVIKESWKVSSNPSWVDLVNGIENCNHQLMRWNKTSFGNVGINIKKLQQKLQDLMSDSVFDVDAIDSCKKEMVEMLNLEEIMWKQRAKEFYIRGGDRNTRYFHLSASKRRHNNHIIGVEDEFGR